MILARHSAIKQWNELLGPVDSEKAKETHPKRSGISKGLELSRAGATDEGRTQRENTEGVLTPRTGAIYGTNKIKNALHGSGCFNTAEREINFMFPNGARVGYSARVKSITQVEATQSFNETIPVINVNAAALEVTIEPFPDGQAAEDYLSKYVNPTLLIGLTEMCKEKPSRPI
eukprot:g32867.t1